jgi:hypothetical protein
MDKVLGVLEDKPKSPLLQAHTARPMPIPRANAERLADPSRIPPETDGILIGDNPIHGGIDNFMEK